jgi:RNA polymerase sigma factor (sigma-70 family)
MYNYERKEEYRKFLIEFAKQKKLMQAAGMSEEDINAIFVFDKAVFNRDRSFNMHKSEYAEPDGEETPSGKKKRDGRDEAPPKEFEERFALSDRLDGAVYEAFATLGEKEKEVMTLCYEKGLSLHQAARRLGVPYQTLKRRHSRAIQKIKSFS